MMPNIKSSSPNFSRFNLTSTGKALPDLDSWTVSNCNSFYRWISRQAFSIMAGV